MKRQGRERSSPGSQKRLVSEMSGRGGKRPPRRAVRGGESKIYLYGTHAVVAALQNESRIKTRLHATENGLARLKKILDANPDLPIRTVDTRELTNLTGPEAVHQGMVLECDPLPMIDSSELHQLIGANLVVALDEITDPHNTGAILRSAAAFAADAVLMTHRNRAAESGVLAKSASGALDHLRLGDIRNLSKSLAELAEMGFAIIGLDSEGPEILENSVPEGQPVVLVLGAEGRGLREKTREACTHLARLDMPGSIRSLNVSNAAALSLYVVRKAIGGNSK